MQLGHIRVVGKCALKRFSSGLKIKHGDERRVRLSSRSLAPFSERQAKGSGLIADLLVSETQQGRVVPTDLQLRDEARQVVVHGLVEQQRAGRIVVDTDVAVAAAPLEHQSEPVRAAVDEETAVSIAHRAADGHITGGGLLSRLIEQPAEEGGPNSKQRLSGRVKVLSAHVEAEDGSRLLLELLTLVTQLGALELDLLFLER
mmetsp:Transcript_75910/g.183470  ORF Transcript_75910/g.183470 Transcript_75910/m.183470 type:complete len:202 (-) Transcript_75910:130-735(-)